MNAKEKSSKPGRSNGYSAIEHWLSAIGYLGFCLALAIAVSLCLLAVLKQSVADKFTSGQPNPANRSTLSA
jgi:hypothetical protein